MQHKRIHDHRLNYTLAHGSAGEPKQRNTIKTQYVRYPIQTYPCNIVI